MRIKHSSERGDTIVEVLICILVISTMLAGAFVTTNNSLQAVRMSQERSQAVKIAESQIESVRALGDNSMTDFCINDSTYTSAASASSCYFLQGGELTSDIGAAVPSAGNIYANAVNGPQYKVRVRTGSPAGTYTISVQWVSAKGSLSTITMYYRQP